MARTKRRRAAAVAKTRDKRREALARQTQRTRSERRPGRSRHERLAPAERSAGCSSGSGSWSTCLTGSPISEPGTSPLKGIENLVAGYPMAALLAIGDAVVLSR
jgi:hypothetical protein